MALRERYASTGYVVCRGWLRGDELERMAESAATLHECKPGRQNMRIWAWALPEDLSGSESSLLFVLNRRKTKPTLSQNGA